MPPSTSTHSSPDPNLDIPPAKTVEEKEEQGETVDKDERNETPSSEEEKSENPNTAATSQPESSSAASTPWQAIYSPQFNAYYFYNSETQETTWENPLAPDSATSSSVDPSSAAAAGPSTSSSEEPSSSSTSSSYPTSSYSALQAAAVAQGIDPSLAHLDPSLAATGPGAGMATARFNARTGQFARTDARDPSHLSEYERMKRMSEFYFDVNAWEQQTARDQAEEEAEGGKKRKRPTKKDVERFKEQKKQKKIAKTAWLRT
ncbi:hypothetical protein AAF712_007513 [Marasmius tenuissimus]|uniref:WW domain-containing protein n=1 Tax=Marasmius tenuissimus TaxID=585030 RepID=A0ABR2ZWB4_9AGAR|nr:hypothetical protein PM082_019340 [Marasmius tenuissimus]